MIFPEDEMIREYDIEYDGSGIGEIISLWMFEPDEDKIERFMKKFDNPMNRLFVYSRDGIIKGAAAISAKSADVEIIGIGVLPAFQKNGIGRELVDYIVLKYTGRKIIAETDDEAVEFYRKNGFSVKCLGEVYTGIRRYSCVK